MNGGLHIGDGLVLAAILFLVLLAILWFVLPFAIFGTKPRLDRLIAEQRRTNDLLAYLVDERKQAKFARETARPDGRREPSP